MDQRILVKKQQVYKVEQLDQHSKCKFVLFYTFSGKSSNTISNISSESLRNSRLLNFAYEYWKMNNPNSIIPSQKQYIDTNQSNVSTTTSVEVKSILKKPDLNSVEKNNWSSNINQTPTANRVSPIPGFSTDDRK